MIKKYHFALLAVMVLAVAAWFVTRPSADIAVEPEDARSEKGAMVTANTNVVRRSLTPEEIEKLGEGHFITKDGKQYFFPTREEDKITRRLTDLLDDDKQDAALEEAKLLKKHPNAEVRSTAASAFHWLGVKGLESLTSMLDDPDPDVAKEAYGHWRDVIGELQSDYDKASLLVAATQVYGDSISMEVLEELVLDAQMLDDMDAIAALKEMLKEMNDPEKITLVGEAIDDLADESQPDLSKKERLAQADQIAKELAAQAKEDAEFSRADE